MRLRFLALLVTASASLAAAPSSFAATASRVGDTVSYTSGRGDRDVARLIVTSGGDYLLRMRSWARQTLRAGRGCAISRPREVRCPGRGVTRVSIRLGDGRSNSFSGQGLRVPITIVGGPGSDLVDLGGLSGTKPVVGATAGATIDTRAGSDSASVVARGGDYVVRGGGGRDSLAVQTVPGAPAGSIELLGGDGNDHLAGGPASDGLDGGAGRDELVSGGGSDDLVGGSGPDTVVFRHPPTTDRAQDRPISVTLDGRRNDGALGDGALVAADVENATIEDSLTAEDTLEGNDGPNVLLGYGTLRGLGGADSLGLNPSEGIPSRARAASTLDGGAGNDRVGATIYNPYSDFAEPVPRADAITCGDGSDVVFTDASDAVPADCETTNPGMHVIAVSKLSSNGQVRVRVNCTDPRLCRLASIGLSDSQRHAYAFSHPFGRRPVPVAVPSGGSVVRIVTFRANYWRRLHNRRAIPVTVSLAADPRSIFEVLNTRVFPRKLTLHR